jgi:1-acyl-sn-glycerol-3-phosphate acyltransferase
LIRFLKLLIRLALVIFCKEVHLKNKHLLNTKGPLLIIANHPNSFLDAIIIGAYYKRRVYFLARGDVFQKKHFKILLGFLNMIPVYRLREGREFLHLNEYAFTKSVDLISKGEAVLIFIEGICLNTNEIQPFKKGTARIVEGLHKNNIFPTIHIAGIAYNHFHGIGKKVNLVITDFVFNNKIENGADRVVFNKMVYSSLSENIITPSQPTKINKTGIYYLHLPYYRFIKKIAENKTRGTVFFDSVLFSLLLFSYPVYLFMIGMVLYFFSLPLTIILIILLALPYLSKQCIS